VIALRAPFVVSLAIATAATAAAAVVAVDAAAVTPSAPGLPTMAPPEPLEMRWQLRAPACDPHGIAAIVIRGQFSAALPQSFAISFGGAQGHYTAMTDQRGYFEVRIPREDFDGDICQLPISSKEFSDAQMTLTYRIDIER
jgi:hypothetical protein